MTGMSFPPGNDIWGERPTDRRVRLLMAFRATSSPDNGTFLSIREVDLGDAAYGVVSANYGG